MEPTPDQIRASIKERYTNRARSPDSEKAFPLGPESAKALGYSPEEIDGLPPSVTESFAGVGNPFLLSELQAGQTVLDLGYTTEPLASGGSTLPLVSASFCCPSPSDNQEFHQRLAGLLRRYNVNDYAASVRAFAVKPG